MVKLEMVKTDEHDAIGSVLLKEMGRATYVQWVIMHATLWLGSHAVMVCDNFRKISWIFKTGLGTCNFDNVMNKCKIGKKTVGML